MKLVAARCPNCNANLDVNPEFETMKCQYCGGAILIDDAINKYKVEISGQIEVKNLPNITNYLKIADRYYNSKNYEEAYENYNKIIELDPNNKIALLRYGICKTLLNNYIDFYLDYLTNSFKEVLKLATEDKTYEKDIAFYVKETTLAIDESLYAIRNYYNSYVVNGSDLVHIQNKLLSIINCYEIVLEHADKERIHIIEQLVSVIRDVIKDKSYKTGTSIEGGNFYKSYKTNYNDKMALVDKLNYYENILNPSTTSNFEGTDKNTLSTSTESNVKNTDKNISISNVSGLKNTVNVKGSIIAIDIFLGTLILGSLISGDIFSSLTMIFIFLIITFDKISERIFKGNNKKKKYCIIFLVIILLIFISYGI